MKKVVFLIVVFFIGKGTLFAHQMQMEGHHHEFTLTRQGAYVANALVWISIGVVIVTLFLTLKYMFFPGEKDPKHIKNIVKDEYFE